MEHSHYTTLNLLKNLTVTTGTGKTLVRGEDYNLEVIFRDDVNDTIKKTTDAGAYLTVDVNGHW